MADTFQPKEKNKGLFDFIYKSIGNKLYSILALVSIVVLIIILTANFTSSTLTMVTSFARMERVHSVALSDAKSSFYKFLVFEDEANIAEFKQYIQKANAYSHTFGGLKSLIKDTPHKEAVNIFNDIFTEVDYRESDIIITRVALLLWNPIVKKLIQIAYETDQLTADYNTKIESYLIEDNPEVKAKLLSEIKTIEIELEALPKQFSDTTGELSDFASTVVTYVLWILFFVLIILCSSIIIPVTRSITKALKRVNASLRDMAEGEGDLTVQLPVTSNDEIGTLSESFNVFIQKLRLAIKDVITNIELQARSTQELNNASSSLSSLANQQASSVEEVSSTLENVSDSVEQNASNVKQTSKLASGVSSKADVGGQSVAETVKNMREIKDKIAIVDEIAFQINLLSLNASVEAAHAGIHGKGFAVVANEVKKLAERTKDAVQDINKLVGESVNASDLAGKVVGEIVPDINETATLLRSITSATEEQSVSFSQISETMNNLSGISINSASMADEIAATSGSLSQMATKLEATVGFFKVD